MALSSLIANRIVDSFALHVCKFGRGDFHKIFKDYGVDYRISASKRQTYYEYKVYIMTIF